MRLTITESAATSHCSPVAFQLDAVLLEEHPGYAGPRPGEQHDYRRATLVIEGPGLEVELSGLPPAQDASGATDLGNIDSWMVDEGGWSVLSGDWGTARPPAPCSPAARPRRRIGGPSDHREVPPSAPELRQPVSAAVAPASDHEPTNEPVQRQLGSGGVACSALRLLSKKLRVRVGLRTPLTSWHWCSSHGSVASDLNVPAGEPFPHLSQASAL